MTNVKGIDDALRVKLTWKEQSDADQSGQRHARDASVLCAKRLAAQRPRHGRRAPCDDATDARPVRDHPTPTLASRRSAYGIGTGRTRSAMASG